MIPQQVVEAQSHVNFVFANLICALLALTFIVIWGWSEDYGTSKRPAYAWFALFIGLAIGLGPLWNVLKIVWKIP